MEYRGKNYTTVQGVEPDTWKWAVQLDEKTVKSGEAKTRASAATNAVWAIDKALAPKGKLTSLAFFIPESGTDLPRPRNFSYFSRFQALEGGTILEEYHISQFTVME